MILPTLDELSKIARSLKKPEISEELRGWSWREPPLLCAYDVKLPISEVFSDACPTGRNVYMRYVLRCKPKPMPAVVEGYLVHAMISDFASSIKKCLLGEVREPLSLWQSLMDNYHELAEAWARRAAEEMRGASPEEVEAVRRKFGRWFRALWIPLSFWICSEYSRAIAKNPFVKPETLLSKVAPAFLEFEVDGSLIGFSEIGRIDALAPFSVTADIKVGAPREIHRLAIAAYAMALESTFEAPIDVGILIYLQLVKGRSVVKASRKVFALTDELRVRAIEERDRKLRIVAEREDPGMPDRCPSHCGFLDACAEG